MLHTCMVLQHYDVDMLVVSARSIVQVYAVLKIANPVKGDYASSTLLKPLPSVMYQTNVC